MKLPWKASGGKKKETHEKKRKGRQRTQKRKSRSGPKGHTTKKKKNCPKYKRDSQKKGGKLGVEVTLGTGGTGETHAPSQRMLGGENL